MKIISIVAYLIIGMTEFGFAETVVEKLEKDLASKAAASRSKGGPNAKIMQAAIDAISTLPKKAPKVGETLAHFSLTDAKGKIVDSRTRSKSPYTVITFYRGGWCPYCNLQLRAFQKVLPEIRKRGGELIAISPETPDNTLNTTQKNALEFTVLSDKDNSYARKLGLVFALPKDLIAIYKKFGIDLPTSNGLDKWELPLSATFVVNDKFEIIYAFVDADYKKRANIDAILQSLEPKKNG